MRHILLSTWTTTGIQQQEQGAVHAQLKLKDVDAVGVGGVEGILQDDGDGLWLETNQLPSGTLCLLVEFKGEPVP